MCMVLYMPKKTIGTHAASSDRVVLVDYISTISSQILMVWMQSCSLVYLIDNIQLTEYTGGQKRLRSSYGLNCSKTDLATDLPMVCKLKFVHCGHILKNLALYVPQFNSDGSQKSQVSHFFHFFHLIGLSAQKPT